MAALSDDAKKRLVIALTSQVVGDEVSAAIDAGQDADVLADYASTANGKGASLVGIEDSGTLITATTVEGALAELATDADAHLADTADAHDASAISVLDTGGLLVAVEVEAALAELAGGADVALRPDLASVANAKGASLVAVEDAGALLATATVEAALNELAKYETIALADPGTGVAIPVTRSASIGIVTAAAETNTLAIPSFIGQKLFLYCDTYAVGNRVVTAAQALNQTGNTIMTFGAVRDNILLQALKVGGALRWQVVANDGVALS